MCRRRRWLPLLLPLVLAACGTATSTEAAAPRAPVTTGASDTRTGPLPGSATASCVEAYTPAAVAGRAFAFDGTVTAISGGTTDRPDHGALGTVAVTFSVHESWRGGAGDEVTVDLMPPGADAQADDEAPPAYEVGTRLLVSGEPRWGGEPLQDAIAWSCGFTRYYDEATAEQWRQALT